MQIVDDCLSVLLAANAGHLIPLEAFPHGTTLYHWRSGWRQTYTNTASPSSMISAWISDDLSLTVSIAGESIFMERWDDAAQTYPHLAVIAEKWNAQLELLGAAHPCASTPGFPSPVDATPAPSLSMLINQHWDDYSLSFLFSSLFFGSIFFYGLAALFPALLTFFHGHF